MILESVAIDFRCGSCGTIRRIDADLSNLVASHLPTGWKVFSKPQRVCCPKCVGSWFSGSSGSGTLEDVRHQRAEERREKMKDIRMPTEERASLDPPPKTMPMPAVPGACSHCGMAIGDEDADWRADPESATFIKIHTRCFRERAHTRRREVPEENHI